MLTALYGARPQFIWGYVKPGTKLQLESYRGVVRLRLWMHVDEFAVDVGFLAVGRDARVTLRNITLEVKVPRLLEEDSRPDRPHGHDGVRNRWYASRVPKNLNCTHIAILQGASAQVVLDNVHMDGQRFAEVPFKTVPRIECELGESLAFCPSCDKSRGKGSTRSSLASVSRTLRDERAAAVHAASQGSCSHPGLVRVGDSVKLMDPTHILADCTGTVLEIATDRVREDPFQPRRVQRLKITGVRVQFGDSVENFTSPGAWSKLERLCPEVSATTLDQL
eukprot:TRINITY_DN35236_c0_g1_i2.p1 TRINITY_DN35236_c0_g1~~TRINITY_DN35236_c0_g1_i2.p1  ORF type:complete len:279 (-),score=20.00 TRINITY_DN35236_c0_g1_i2:132-968(-)